MLHLVAVIDLHVVQKKEKNLDNLAHKVATFLQFATSMSRTFATLRKSEERQQIRESDGDSDGGREARKAVSLLASSATAFHCC